MSGIQRTRLRLFVLATFVLIFVCFPARQFAQQSSTQDLDQLLASKESGLLTDWRVIGPFGKTSDFKRVWEPERDQLHKRRYGNDFVISLQFASGKFELPLHAPRNGVFYASSEVWLPNGGDWRIYAETAGVMTVFLDGKATLHRNGTERDLQTTSQVVHMERGTHRLLVKFAGAAAPFHVAVMPQTGGLRRRNNKPNIHVAPESEYTSAALEWPAPIL
jgi:hypothetical protein